MIDLIHYRRARRHKRLATLVFLGLVLCLIMAWMFLADPYFR